MAKAEKRKHAVASDSVFAALRLGVDLFLRPTASLAGTDEPERFVFFVSHWGFGVSIVLRHGDVVAVSIAFTLSTLPLPLIVQPAHAQQGCDPPPTATPTRTPTLTRTPSRTNTPTRTPTPVPLGELFHFHVDHLGSTQLITDINGNADQYIRYSPYGTVRQRYSGIGTPYGFDERLRYEFTGYETEAVSGLQYAGARFYDPELGMFLTHDPARQFANPYAYGPWDPINGSDPTGAIWELFVVGFIIGFAAAAIQAGVNGASLGEALKAGAVSGIIGGFAGVGVVGLAAEAIHPIAELAYNAALAGSAGYSAVQSFESGQGVLGAVSVVGLAFGLYGVAKAGGRVAQWAGGNLSTVTQGGPAGSLPFDAQSPSCACSDANGGTFNDFLDALGRQESQGSGGYAAQNRSGHVGKYQFGESALVDTGYYLGDRTAANDWIGKWTGTDGVNSLANFKDNPLAQEVAIRSLMRRNWITLGRMGATGYVGSTIGGVNVTGSGLLAGAHLGGPGAIRAFFAGNNLSDGAATVGGYMRKFGGYEIPY